MSSVLKYGAILFYTATFVLILWRVHRLRDEGDVHGRDAVVSVLWGVACLLHAIHLYPQTFTVHGLNLTFYNALSIVLFMIAGLTLLLSVAKKTEFLGLFVLPLVVAGVALTIIRPQVVAAASSVHGLQLHIVSSLFAFSILTIAAVQSVLLLTQDRRLRRHNLDGITRAFPSLHDTERLLFQMIVIGFVLLSVALASGFLFLEDMFEQHVAHKTILSILAWIVFALLLWGRRQFGWRGRVAMHWTLSGFGFLILAYLGSKFVRELILHRVPVIPLS